MSKTPFFYRPARQGYRRPATVFRAAPARPAPALAASAERPVAAASPPLRWALAA
ncbi:hypothetical protein [Hymenobacter yonginensis]|uniref:Uncharacterized protein n=1 Tax=Hymenobacter yonginensis TaxID=748197 RepID=A0ABY7PP69_9BACT|nr:hypothetical protein [Hymenobacter yonginensis]WBO84412.1 hypothetical protein O9Z63_18840 [Hymenobacter yonginensis]